MNFNIKLTGTRSRVVTDHNTRRTADEQQEHTNNILPNKADRPRRCLLNCIIHEVFFGYRVGRSLHHLARHPRLTVGAAGEDVGIVGLVSAARAVAFVGLEWMSKGVVAAAGLGAATGAVFGGAHGTEIECRVFVFVLWLELHATKERLEDVADEYTLNDACTSCTVVGWVQVGTSINQSVDIGGVSRDILNFPRDALGLVILIGVDHRAVIALVQQLTEPVNFIERLRFTLAMILLKVAPASVLIDGLKGWPEKLAERSLAWYCRVHISKQRL